VLFLLYQWRIIFKSRKLLLAKGDGFAIYKAGYEMEKALVRLFGQFYV